MTRPRSSSSSSTSSTSPRTRPRSTDPSSTMPSTRPPRQTCDGHATKGQRDPETDEALNAILNWEPAPPQPQPPQRPLKRTGTPPQRPVERTKTLRGLDPVQAGAARASGLFTPDQPKEHQCRGTLEWLNPVDHPGDATWRSR